MKFSNEVTKNRETITGFTEQNTMRIYYCGLHSMEKVGKQIEQDINVVVSAFIDSFIQLENSAFASSTSLKKEVLLDLRAFVVGLLSLGGAKAAILESCAYRPNREACA